MSINLDKIYQWEKVENLNRNDFISLNNSISGHVFSPEKSTFKVAKGIRFYFDYDLFEVTQEYWPYPSRMFFNRNKGTFFQLDGTNRLLYEFNDRFNLFHPKKTIAGHVDELCRKYIRFFFDNVEGPRGMFHIFEDYAELIHQVKLFYQFQPEKLQVWSDRADQAIVKCMMRDSVYDFAVDAKKGFGMKLIDNDSNDNNILKRTYGTYMLFKGQIFYAKVTVTSDPKENVWGHIQLSEETLVTQHVKKSPTVHELQKWGPIFTKYGVDGELPPLHEMDISSF